MIEQLLFHFSLSCIGEGNGNPFQCSCLENLRDGGPWWAAVYGVAQSRTRQATWRQQALYIQAGALWTAVLSAGCHVFQRIMKTKRTFTRRVSGHGIIQTRSIGGTGAIYSEKKRKIQPWPRFPGREGRQPLVHLPTRPSDHRSTEGAGCGGREAPQVAWW